MKMTHPNGTGHIEMSINDAIGENPLGYSCFVFATKPLTIETNPLVLNLDLLTI